MTFVHRCVSDVYTFHYSKPIERGRKKADSYYNREQTRDCIGGGSTPRLTTLCGSRGSNGLFLQWFHLLLVYLLFLCKPRKPTRVTQRSLHHTFTYDDLSPGSLTFNPTCMYLRDSGL
jgi:hypothetical protein